MNIQNKRVTVMGLGRFGGGVGVTKWLLSKGALVTITDLADQSELEEQLEEIGTNPHVKRVFGEHREEDFATADLVVVNPAVPKPWNNPYLKIAWDAGVRITTEIEIVTQLLNRKQIIGVTGTSGKSTTVSMIHAALQASGMCSHLGGNIGGSLLDNINEIQPDDVVVLELSSAMLWWLNRVGNWAPHISVLTNITENHLDWHGTVEEYVQCKRYIFEHQTEDDISLSQDISATFSGLQVVGLHNERNAAVSFLAAIALGADRKRARLGIQRFKGLSHRLERVGDCFYNDSKSTTPIATKLAVDSFPESTGIHLIVGGCDKGINLRLLADQSERVCGMYCIGATGKIIAELANQRVELCHTLECAIELAMQRMEEGEILLLSPGCASWDQFENYEKRGERFCELVMSF